MDIGEVIAVRNTKEVYRNGDKVIKLFKENYSKSNILNEALNQARVEETRLNIPKLLEVTTIGNRWAIISEYIEGENLETLMAENIDRKNYYMKLFVDIQLEILNSEVPPMLNKLKEKMRRKIGQANLEDALKYDLNTRLESMPMENRLCHGDFNPSNIILKEDGTYYIIDWAHVTCGNTAADVARTYLLFSIKGKIDEAEEYLNIFSEKSNVDKKEIQRWIPILAASQLTKENEEEREFLMHWVDVIEY